MLPTSLPLNALQSSVVHTRKEGSHTDYAIMIQHRAGSHNNGDIVYRRFSAFLQLQSLARRHFQESNTCCAGSKGCLLQSFLGTVFSVTEFPVMQSRLRGKNSKVVVKERVLFLSAFLMELEEALQQCPPLIIHRSESYGCKLTKLLKSFYGIDSNTKHPVQRKCSI